MRALSDIEARVLGVLVEKQATVPDTYPLSLNALGAGCNQKNAREPLMAVTESELVVAIDALKALNLVVEVSGSRVARYEHNLPRALALPGASVALLATLALRGPQTAAELRLHSERLHRFADVSAVEGFLDELATKGTPRVRLLPRAAGAREARWMHLLCGEPASAPASDIGDNRAAAGVIAGDALLGAAATPARLTAPPPSSGSGSVLRFPIPEVATLSLQYETTIPIRWGDMDAMGHVNNTLYFRYMEVVRIDWFRLLGTTPDLSDVGPIIINAFCTFHRQLEFPGEVRARLYVGALGRSTIDTYTTLERCDEPGLFYATGGAAVVWTDFKARKSVPLPEAIRRRLGG